MSAFLGSGAILIWECMDLPSWEFNFWIFWSWHILDTSSFHCCFTWILKELSTSLFFLLQSSQVPFVTYPDSHPLLVTTQVMESWSVKWWERVATAKLVKDLHCDTGQEYLKEYYYGAIAAINTLNAPLLMRAGKVTSCWNPAISRELLKTFDPHLWSYPRTPPANFPPQAPPDQQWLWEEQAEQREKTVQFVLQDCGLELKS